MREQADSKTIPIVIGVTGHRDLREQDVPMLREHVRAELEKLKTEYPHSPLVMLNSLAAGADTLCAKEAVALGIPLVCPLPMEAEEYRRDFSESELKDYSELLLKAERVFVAPDMERVGKGNPRDYLYRQASIYVAAHSHVLFALWDGSPSRPDGCGTAEAVDFILRSSYKGGFFKAVNDGAVLHIRTPRQSGHTEQTIDVQLIENEPGSLRNALKMTDEFNAEQAEGYDEFALLPKEHISAGLQKLSGLYHRADRLALQYQKHYLRAIKWFSVFGILLVLFFLFYDEMESDFFLLCYGAIMLGYGGAYAFVKRGRAHEKYLQYRTLSEALRVQLYLSAAGISVNIGNAFTWTQKQEASWVKEALSALLVGIPACEAVPDDVIKRYWIDGQFTYHENALKRDAHEHRINENTAKAMLLASVLIFFIVLILEFFFTQAITASVMKTPLPSFFMQHGEQEIIVRSLLKIILGAVSAVTAFLANYYGKLSLARKCADHEKMALLYDAAKKRFESGFADRDSLFYELAREEVIESGNWFSYCKEDSPSFNV